MRSATRDLVNAPGRLGRRLTPNLSRALALALAALALVGGSSVAFADTLTVHLGPPGADSRVCDFFGCLGALSGDLTDVSQPGTYSMQLALDMPPDPSVLPLCYTPTSGAVNETILTFTKSGAAGQLTLETGGFCYADIITEAGQFAIDFTIKPGSGTGSYAGAQGTGTITANFNSSPTGGTNLDYQSVDGTFILPDTDPCKVLGACPPPPPTGDTPELDSLLLFGSGLTGFVTYAIRRRRAGKLPK